MTFEEIQEKINNGEWAIEWESFYKDESKGEFLIDEGVIELPVETVANALGVSVDDFVVSWHEANEDVLNQLGIPYDCHEFKYYIGLYSEVK